MTDPDQPAAPVPGPDDRLADDIADDVAAAAAAAALRRVTKSTARAKPRAPRAKPAAYSDDRDPQLLGAAVDRLVRDQGWQDQSAVAILMAEWAGIVGVDLAEHVTPMSFAEGELTLLADSTAWATQVRLLLPDLHRTIDARVGTGVVTRIRIQGPQTPSWTAGPRRVQGRGPRDTYG